MKSNDAETFKNLSLKSIINRDSTVGMATYDIKIPRGHQIDLMSHPCATIVSVCIIYDEVKLITYTILLTHATFFNIT